jgi:predicted transcriptional regulator
MASTALATVPLRGRPPVLAQKFNTVDLLRQVAAGERPSYYLVRQLVEKGYVSATPVKETEGRGRPTLKYGLTTKGKTYVAFSRNWK